MINNNIATELDQSTNRRITLTTFSNFLLCPPKGRRKLVDDSNIKITYPPYWNPVRHAIARVHNSAAPNYQELIDLALSTKPENRENYIRAARSYTLASNGHQIQGKKLKRLKNSVVLSGMEIALNPELCLGNEHEGVVVKLHFSKSRSMTQFVAEQVLALMSEGLIYNRELNLRFLIVDVYRGVVFEQLGIPQIGLDLAQISAQKFVGYDTKDEGEEFSA